MFSLNMAPLLGLLGSHSRINRICDALSIVFGFRLLQDKKLLRHQWSNVNVDFLLDLDLYYFSPFSFSYLAHN